MPPTDPRYLAYTPEQMWVEFMEDMLERDPDKLDKLLGIDKAAVQYVTGVSDIDALEAANARGDHAEVARLVSLWGKPAAAAVEAEEEVFADSYTEPRSE